MIPLGPLPVQPTREPQTGAPFDRLPADVLDLRAQLETKLMTDRQHSTRDEVMALNVGQVVDYAALHERRARDAHPFGGIPVAVLTRGSAKDAMIAAHADLAAQSTNGWHIVVAGAGHEIHLFQPDVVVQAIYDVLDSRGNR